MKRFLLCRKSATTWPFILILALLLAACSLSPATPAPTPALPIVPTSALPIVPTALPTAVGQTPLPATLVPPTLAPAATSTPVPQQIIIDTPAPGTLVGSPVVITGRTARFPSAGNLNYRIYDVSGTQIGAGSIPVSGSSGQPGSFAPSISFGSPPNGGTIRADIFEQDATTGQTVASASIDLFVAPPQAITITSPPSGTLVGSPVVVTGQLARLPFQSNLFYRVVDARGQQIGSGLLPVSGTAGRPTSFNASLAFRLPVDGGNIRLELFDQNAADNTVAASAALALRVAPQQQAITIETPPSGIQVGSPVVITGRTVRYPFQGKLNYRVADQNGGQLGVGAFNVNGAPGGSATFNASIDFNLPPAGGAIQIELYDQNAQTGVIVASTLIGLQVAPPGPTPVPQQVITIETPPPRTLVGTPVVVTGRTTRYPFAGHLNYTVRSANGQEIGSGIFPVNAAPDQGSTFVASLNFRQEPADTSIRVEIFERDDRTGAIIAIASVDLRVDPLRPRQ